MDGTYTQCYGTNSTGDTVEIVQSWDCLMHDQDLAYQWIYCLHYVGLAYMVAHWLTDLVQIPFWINTMVRGRTALTLFGGQT